MAGVRARANGGASPSSSAALTVRSNSAGLGRRRRGRRRRASNGSRGSRRAAACTEGRSDIAVLDVGELDGGVGGLGLDDGRVAGGGVAGAASGTGRGRGVGSRVGAVEPVHACGVVIPDREGEDHALAEARAHLRKTALRREVGRVAESGLLLRAEGVGDGVGGVYARNVGHRVLDDHTVLDVDAADLAEGTGGRVVVGDELGDNGEGLRGIDSVASAEERLVAETVSVEVAAVLVTDTVVALVTSTTIGASAAGLAVDGAWVRGVS